MRAHARIAAIALAVCAVTAVAVRAETIDEVKKKIHEKVSKYKSIQYTLEMKTDMDTPQFKMSSTTRQTAQFVNKGDKILARMESETSSTQKMGEQENKQEVKSLDVCDGNFWYSMADQGGEKTATKRKADVKKEGNPFDPQNGFKQMEEHFDVKLMPDETVNGKPAWVFEMKLKPGNPAASMMGRALAYYDKETGVSLKGVSFDPAGKPTSTSTTTDVKIDADIPADRFVFKAPEGVTVQEMPEQQMPSMP